MSTDAFKSRDRYIAIGGENWSAALGTDAKYLTPKVGIFLYGLDGRDMREQVEHMAFMSANAEMTVHPLLQIMEVMQATFIRHGRIHSRLHAVPAEFKKAIAAVRAAQKAIEESRK